MSLVIMVAVTLCLPYLLLALLGARMKRKSIQRARAAVLALEARQNRREELEFEVKRWPTVTVTVDGVPTKVPPRVDSWAGVRAVLSIPPGSTVMVRVDDIEIDDAVDGREAWALLGDGEADVPGKVVRFWEFSEGDEFRRIPLDAAEEDDEDRPEPWQDGEDGESWKNR